MRLPKSAETHLLLQRDNLARCAWIVWFPIGETCVFFNIARMRIQTELHDVSKDEYEEAIDVRDSTSCSEVRSNVRFSHSRVFCLAQRASEKVEYGG